MRRNLPLPPAPDRPLRLCFLNDHLGYGGTALHGVSRYFLNVIPHLDRERFDPFVTVLRPRNDLASVFDKAGIPIAFVPRRMVDPLGLLGFLALLRRQQVDLIHAQGYAGTTLARLTRRPAGTGVILHGHDAGSHYPAIMSLPDRLLSGQEDAVLAVSPEAARFLVERRHITADRTEILSNGVDLSRLVPSSATARARLRAAMGARPGRPLLLCVTRFRPEKGNDILIRSLPALLKTFPDLVLMLAGEGPRMEACRSLTRQLGVDRCVRFLGFRQDVTALISAADAVVVPSRREGSPFTVLEALALGAPLVASRIGGLQEILEESAAALLVPVEDSEALAAALRRVLSEPQLRQQLKEKARRLAQRYDIRVHTHRLEQIYMAVARRRHLF